MLQRELRRIGITAHREPIVAGWKWRPVRLSPPSGCDDFGLPRGCILVRSYAGGREWVPMADTASKATCELPGVKES